MEGTPRTGWNLLRCLRVENSSFVVDSTLYELGTRYNGSWQSMEPLGKEKFGSSFASINLDAVRKGPSFGKGEFEVQFRGYGICNFKNCLYVTSRTSSRYVSLGCIACVPIWWLTAKTRLPLAKYKAPWQKIKTLTRSYNGFHTVIRIVYPEMEEHE